MDELKQLFKELLIIVQQYEDSSYNPQKEILKRIINDMESYGTDIDKFSQVKREYKKLFFPKSPLSEFNIWKDDFTERKKLNSSLENIKNRLWDLLNG
ncbi:MAG: hypothetical protein K2L07_09065 [Lachnospiraceae bacterium]|nr:hypothetical protein [Lachnospiraceae bacterium]